MTAENQELGVADVPAPRALGSQQRVRSISGFCHQSSLVGEVAPERLECYIEMVVQSIIVSQATSRRRCHLPSTFAHLKRLELPGRTAVPRITETPATSRRWFHLPST